MAAQRPLIQRHVVPHHRRAVGHDHQLRCRVDEIHQFLHQRLGQNDLAGFEGGALLPQRRGIQLGIHHNHPPRSPVQAVLCPQGKERVDHGAALEYHGAVGVGGTGAVDLDAL